MEYYENIASGYNELHKEEQLAKLRIISSHLNIQKEDKLLDLGCGTGLSSEIFKCQITGLEPSRRMMKKGGKNQLMDLIQGEGEHLPFNDCTFNFVICVTALHNFKDPHTALREMKRVVTKSGAITILKKAKRAQMLQNMVAEEFNITKVVEEEKDHILFFEIYPPKQLSGINP
jgi:ubiquinone/menaquinone biosynthesis C-methylase UbiE